MQRRVHNDLFELLSKLVDEWNNFIYERDFGPRHPECGRDKSLVLS
jgi:hypothetical protein